MNPIIIVGTGLAGYQLAREFRKLDQTTPLILVTSSDGRFYPKPQLSTAQTNKKSTETLTTASAENMAAQLNATIRTHTFITAIFPKAKKIQLGNKEMEYEKLILACGAEVVKPPIRGNAIADVLSINHLEDYAFFEKAILNKKQITILGAGLIGCEFANDLSNQGFEVHVVDPARSPISLLLPGEIGKLLQKALEKNGVHFHFGCVAEQINKINSHYELSLSTGEKISTQITLSAIGLRPSISLAQQAGIETARGITVNRYLETSAPSIYALGDCAEVEGHVLPYIAPILNASRALAKSLAGERTAVDYPAMPVIVKTPAHPIIICPPPRNMKGLWQIEKNDNNVKALFYNEQQALYGFVLTNECVKERASLTSRLPKLF